ncbi:MAG: PHP domain-containing protein [Desulfobacter sp.]|nr:PHP domain-containing protein [Desulfobacter sp.]
MIPLTCRSHYSLMWGTASVERLCARARQLGYSALALTDTDNLYGLWDFLSACRTHGLKPIVGAEITDPSSPHRAICLVKNDQGYHHLCTLLTRRHQDKHFSLKQAIPPLGRGMVILTRSSELLADWHDQDPCLDLGAALPRAPLSCRHDLCRTARKRSLPMVATPGSFFLHSRDHGTHALVRAIDTNQCLSRLGHGDLAPENTFLNSPEYYQQKFSILPQAVKATYALGERLNFQGPDFGIVMPPFEPGPGRTAHDLLRKKTMEGAEKRGMFRILCHGFGSRICLSASGSKSQVREWAFNQPRRRS